MANYQLLLKTEFSDLDLSEVLIKSPFVLIGVTPTQETTLKGLKAQTVFDLANCAIFVNAAAILDASINPELPIAQHQMAPAEMIDAGALALELTELVDSSIENLIGIGVNNVLEVTTNLSVSSIRDLALWPPFIAAKALITEAYTPFNIEGYDEEAPEELIPRIGQLATQQSNYRRTVMIESKPSSTIVWDGGLVDLTVLDEIGFGDIAFGAIMTFRQRWTPKRLALGSLLHSLPLGPGESTKIAVVDWVSRLSSQSRESLDQREELDNSMRQSTAISEITSAVAQEDREGESSNNSQAVSFSAGGTGVISKFLLGGGVSTNASHAGTYSVSSTNRSEVASALQSISSSTHQNSSMSRSKRASVITEVSRSESESLTTRTVTNYNHMHAMSIQYYEMVQIYETELRMSRIERAIFIPMLKINFRSEDNINRYLIVLIRFAINAQIRKLLNEYKSTIKIEFPFDRLSLDELEVLEASVRGISITSFFPFTSSVSGTNGMSLQEFQLVQLRIRQLRTKTQTLTRNLSSNYQLARRYGVLEAYELDQLGSLTFDKGTLIDDVHWPDNDGISAMIFTLTGGNQVRVQTSSKTMTFTSETTERALVTSLELGDIQNIELEVISGDDASNTMDKFFRVYLRCSLRGKAMWFNCSFIHRENLSGSIILLNMNPPVNVEDIADHLMDNQLYYSQRVWQHSNSQSLLLQLTPYTVDIENENIRIVDYIDPKPVTVAGNYLAFRFTYESDKEWLSWKNEQQKARPIYDLIPVSSGGVFAEAVLGEYNSAEKLDATRFWNWKDSPIPFSAPEIAALTAGQQQRTTPPSPGSFNETSIKLINLSALPEGLATSKNLLSAIIAENIFNNMGGADIAKNLIIAAQDAAKNGNLETFKSLQSTAQGMFSSMEELLSAVLKSENGVSNITQLGGLLNQMGGGAAPAAGAASGGAAGGATGAVGSTPAVASLMSSVAQVAPLLLV